MALIGAAGAFKPLTAEPIDAEITGLRQLQFRYTAMLIAATTSKTARTNNTEIAPSGPPPPSLDARLNCSI